MWHFFKANSISSVVECTWTLKNFAFRNYFFMGTYVTSFWRSRFTIWISKFDYYLESFEATIMNTCTIQVNSSRSLLYLYIWNFLLSKCVFTHLKCPAPLQILKHHHILFKSLLSLLTLAHATSILQIHVVENHCLQRLFSASLPCIWENNICDNFMCHVNKLHVQCQLPCRVHFNQLVDHCVT